VTGGKHHTGRRKGLELCLPEGLELCLPAIRGVSEVEPVSKHDRAMRRQVIAHLRQHGKRIPYSSSPIEVAVAIIQYTGRLDPAFNEIGGEHAVVRKFWRLIAPKQAKHQQHPKARKTHHGPIQRFPRNSLDREFFAITAG
jgi:hypothetical protein